MGRNTRTIDMVNGSILKSVIYFSLPLIFGNILQLLYNAADLVVVSRFAGSDAMASVGATGSLSSLIISLFIGLSVGTSVLVSKRYGAGDSAGVFRSVHTSVLLSIVSGIAAMFVGVAFCKNFLIWMGTPEGSVLNGAVTYMRIYFMGVPASLVYNFGAAILRAVGDAKRPLWILAFSGIVNVVLNLVLVIRFHLGVAGVAIATTVSNYVSAIAVLFVLLRADGAYRLVIKELRIHKKELIEIVKVGLPAGLQTSLFAIANTLIQSSVNSFKEAAIAGSAAASNIEGFVYTAMNAIYQATLTSVSQNYGAKKPERVKKSFRVCLVAVVVVGVVLGVLVFLLGKPLLRIYITDSPEALRCGIIKLTYVALPYFLCGIMEVQAGMLRGLGYSTSTMINSLIGACAFRVAWVTWVLPLNRSLDMLFLCWPVSWIIVIIMNYILYICIKKKVMYKIQSANCK